LFVSVKIHCYFEKQYKKGYFFVKTMLKDILLKTIICK
jgi:hypothetical protein